MAVEHRKRSRQAKRVAIVATATATVSALTVGAAPAPVPEKRSSDAAVDLAAAIQLLPDSGQFPNPKAYPDITGGLGTTLYNVNQAIFDQLARAIVNGISLTALAQAAGVDPKSLVDGLLTNIPANLLPDILAAISLDIPVLGTALQQLQLAGGDQNLLSNALRLLGVDNITDKTLTGLLALLGLNLSDPLNLSTLAVPGINLITPGMPFGLLKMLGVDLGWVPGLPNSVAAEINGSEYLKLGVNGVIELLQDRLQEAIDNDTLELLDLGALEDILGGLGIELPPVDVDLSGVVGDVIDSLGALINPITSALPDLLHLRVTPTVGLGLGAFATAMAYQQVVADLANQPGGINYPGLTGEVNPLLGSLTVLPMILINNPARPDGGLAARFGSVAALLGIDTVNPHTQLTGNGGTAVGTTGLHLGGANVLPILIDATYEYQPLSDLASWPNAFSLVNNLAAGLSPTYMLRGLQLDGLTGQLTSQLGAALQDVANGNPLALNLYLTLQSKTLPMLEPLYLASDFLNLVGLAPLAQIPMRIANALAPALRILTDIGYANTVRKPDGTYVREFENAGQEVPFLSFPNINPLMALSDSFNALIGGIQKELGPNPTPGTPNVLKTLLDAILGGGLGGVLPGGTTPAPGTGTPSTGNPLTDLLGGLLGPGGLLGGLFGGLGLQGAAPSTLAAQRSASEIPEANARFSTLSISAGGEDESLGAADGSDEQAGAEAQADPEGEGDAGKAADEAETPPAAEGEDAGEQGSGDQASEEAAPAAEKPAADEPTGSNGTESQEQQKDDEPSVDEVKTPKHAKEDDGSTPPASTTSPKHAKPESPNKPSLNVVRDTANAFSPADKPGPSAEAGSAGDEDKGAADAGAADASAGAGSASDGGASDAA